MESEKEETPADAGKDEENINPVASASSSDGGQDISQGACAQPESSNEQLGNGNSLDGMYFNFECYKTSIHLHNSRANGSAIHFRFSF